MDGEQMLAKYSAEARRIGQPLSTLGVPMTVFLGEAIDVAGFAKKYWQPVVNDEGVVLRPGLSQVNKDGSARLPQSIGTEIDELVAGASAAHQRYTFSVEPEGRHPMEEGERVLSEVTAALEFLFDDGEETPDDAALARLSELHAEPTSHDAMALALEDYAALARPHRSTLDGLGGFDVNLIDRAGQLAETLRARSAPPAGNTSEALLFRDQMFTLLHHRIREVRRASNFVFRNHPEIARLATSSYQRRRRAAARRQNKGGAATASSGQGPTPA